MKPFPAGFLWGTSQAGHQIEGDNFDSDWWHWEQRPGRIDGGTNSQDAAQHLSQFKRDFDLARDLGQNAFLFSLEWARIQPREGEFNEAALVHYRNVLQALAARKIEPICVLQHVTVPRWFAEKFGWHHRNAPALFEAYAQRIAQELGGLCNWWIPIREPMHWCTMAYMLRKWSPARRSPARARRSIQHMAEAHAAAYRALKQANPPAMVGSAILARRFQPLDSESPWDYRAALREQRRCNRLWLDALTEGRWPLRRGSDVTLRGSIDFAGVSYYGNENIRFSVMNPSRIFSQLTRPSGEAIPGVEFEPHPQGLREILNDLSDYGLPIIVTANGLATNQDPERCQYLVDHALALSQSLDDGVDLRGYCVRSLLDGFEWDAGDTQRYGLVHVDRKTHVRTPNASALVYKELCTTNALSSGTVAKYHLSDPESASQERA